MCLTTKMIRCRLDKELLLNLGRRRRIPISGEVDYGYLTHVVTCEAFGEYAPKPFAVTHEEGTHLTVLGYVDKSTEDLIDYAVTFSDPAVYNIIDWEHFDTKPMPIEWRQGARYDFELTSLPVFRLWSDYEKKMVEKDVFLFELDRQKKNGFGEYIYRQDIYREWIRMQLRQMGGASICNCLVDGWNIERFVRSTHWKEYPDRPSYRYINRVRAKFCGGLVVTDGEEFSKLLRYGIGFHRTFGFGMIRLCPAGTFTQN